MLQDKFCHCPTAVPHEELLEIEERERKQKDLVMRDAFRFASQKLKPALSL